MVLCGGLVPWWGCSVDTCANANSQSLDHTGITSRRQCIGNTEAGSIGDRTYRLRKVRLPLYERLRCTSEIGPEGGQRSITGFDLEQDATETARDTEAYNTGTGKR